MKDDHGNVREEEISVEQYYFDVYSYKLKYPDLPALDVGNKKKPTFIPLEVTLGSFALIQFLRLYCTIILVVSCALMCFRFRCSPTKGTVFAAVQDC